MPDPDVPTPPITPVDPPPPAPGPEPRRLLRSRTDRVLGGLCGGLARHLGIDPIIVRVGAVALAVLTGGLGVLVYLAGLLLVPTEPVEGTQAGAVAAGGSGTSRTVTIAAVVVLGLIALALAPGFGFVLVPLAMLAFLGLAAWWLASGGRIGDSPRAVLTGVALGLLLLVVSGGVALAGAWAAATGGGVITALLIIGAGVALVVGAFLRPLRAVILPALALALAVGFVSAVGIDLDGGVGEREYRPASGADVRERYEIGAGRMLVDLRDVPPGALAGRTVAVDVGMGEALVLVPDSVCVASRGRVGMGRVANFDRESGGVDVDVDDAPRASAGGSLLLLDADVGLGQVEIGRNGLVSDFGDDRRSGRDGGWDFGSDEGGLDLRAANAACARGDASS